MIGRSTGHPVSITGLGASAPERVLTNEELAKIVDTSDEWIVDAHRHQGAPPGRA